MHSFHHEGRWDDAPRGVGGEPRWASADLGSELRLGEAGAVDVVTHFAGDRAAFARLGLLERQGQQRACPAGLGDRHRLAKFSAELFTVVSADGPVDPLPVIELPALYRGE